MTKNKIPVPQLIIIIFLLIMLVTAAALNIPLYRIINDSLIKLAMNGVLVLSLIPMINTGVGMNYGLPIGITAGLIALCLSINFYFIGMTGFILSIIFSIPISIVFGILYSKILNRVKGQEEIAATFVGFSFIPLMNFFWTLAPFTNREMLWPIGGKGVRPSISLQNYFLKVLDNFAKLDFGSIKIPCGLLFFFAFIALFIFIFFKTRVGKAMIALGENEGFAYISSININRTRTLSIILSTIIGALGIIVYSQSYGFVELYDAPSVMTFPAISAILIGGSVGSRISVVQAILGTYLFQTIYLLSIPIANAMLIPEMAEILRMIITNGIILYALLYKGGKIKNEKI